MVIFILIIIIAVKQGERELKNTLQVFKVDERSARKTTERFLLTKKNSLTNQLEVKVFKRHEVGRLLNALFLEKTLVKRSKIP